MKLFRELFISAAIHLFLFGAGLSFLAWGRAHASMVAEIDLQGSSLLFRPSHLSGHRSEVPPQPWILASGTQASPAVAPLPQALTATLQIQEEPVGEACPPPCPQNAADWAAVASASRRPEWIEGQISEDDYPSNAKRQGKEAKLKAEVLIDTSGMVRRVQLMQEASPEFNELVLKKLRGSRFSPALDQDGKPISVRMLVPITFKLR